MKCNPLAPEAAAWEDLSETFELLRLLCARPEVWEARSTAGLEMLLSPRERLALPGEDAKVVFVSTFFRAKSRECMCMFRVKVVRPSSGLNPPLNLPICDSPGKCPL